MHRLVQNFLRNKMSRQLYARPGFISTRLAGKDLRQSGENREELSIVQSPFCGVALVAVFADGTVVRQNIAPLLTRLRGRILNSA